MRLRDMLAVKKNENSYVYCAHVTPLSLSFIYAHERRFMRLQLDEI